VGSVTALTTLSPVRRELQGKLALRLALISGFPALGRPLAELAFIHYARWTVLESAPAPDGSGEHVPLASRYLLFESNYNGHLGDYLDAFADVLPHRLARLWGTCEQFEETVQQADGGDGPMFPSWAFRDYVQRNELEVLHFHAAYPDATMIDVRQALAVADERRRAGRRYGGPVDATVRRAVPLVLGPEPPSLSRRRKIGSLVAAQGRALARSYGVNPFGLLTPVDPNAADALFERLRQWPEGDGRSPLRALSDTHFARLVRVPPELKYLGQPDRDDLGAPYLLYTSNHLGPERAHIGRLRDELGSIADEIWEHSPGYPGHADRAFEEWVKRHRVGTRYFAYGYAPRDVAQVRQALADRERLATTLWERGPSRDWLED
jgi:hypothetical protein